MSSEELYCIEPVNYYICGNADSGKTLLVKKWLERISEKNGVLLDYGGNPFVIRADLVINRPIGKTKVIVYENFDPRKKGTCYYGIPDLNELFVSTVFVSRDSVKNTTYRVRKMFKEFGFRVIDMDQEKKVNETVEQTVNRIVNDMECPIFRFFEENEKKPKAPQTGDN